ncbi:MAG TPA: hypothetical protein VN803_11675, partial [Gemmatimonadales bacterium]|nr:hypothetical protein [Gemmatimonadales bacterium]
MRIAPLALCACLGAASAAYCQDGKATQPGAAERVRLEKCFADMLAVAKRHGLSDRAGSLLEAGCDREMETYKTA